MKQPDYSFERTPHAAVIDLLLEAESSLRTAGVTVSPRLDAEVLLADLLHRERAQLLASYPDRVEPQVITEYRRRISRRSTGEPVAYIIGKREFMGLEFFVDPRVLIPRPETETLVEYILDLSRRRNLRRVLDVGAGSGCIIVSLAVLLPDIEAHATDISPGALEVAKQNAQRHGVLQKIRFHLGTWYEGLPDSFRNSFDIIVSNPPYIPDAEYPTLQKNVREYEPETALKGGPDGLGPFRALVAGAADWLVAGGILAAEIGEGQAEPASEIVSRGGQLEVVEVVCDLAGRQRLIVGRKRHE